MNYLDSMKKQLISLTEADAPGQYKDTNPYNDFTSIDEYRRDNEDTEPERDAPGQEGEHKHHNPLTAIETLFSWLCNEKGRIYLDPEVLSVRAELGTTVSAHILLRYLSSKGLVFRTIPCKHIIPGRIGYGIAIVNSKNFQNIEIEDTLSGQTFHKDTKFLAFKYYLHLDINNQFEHVLEFYDPETNVTITTPANPANPNNSNNLAPTEENLIVGNLIWYLT